jgi:ATP-dependent exoDNAse (exonuclease V) beta subunit
MVVPGDITILSPLDVAHACVSTTAAFRSGAIRELDPHTAAQWPVSATTCASIADFKGLENTFILVTDIERLAPDDASTNNLYVAMSRARASLWLCVRSPLKNTMKKIAQTNFARMTRA